MNVGKVFQEIGAARQAVEAARNTLAEAASGLDLSDAAGWAMCESLAVGDEALVEAMKKMNFAELAIADANLRLRESAKAGSGL